MKKYWLHINEFSIFESILKEVITTYPVTVIRSDVSSQWNIYGIKGILLERDYRKVLFYLNEIESLYHVIYTLNDLLCPPTFTGSPLSNLLNRGLCVFCCWIYTTIDFSPDFDLAVYLNLSSPSNPTRLGGNCTYRATLYPPYDIHHLRIMRTIPLLSNNSNNL